VSDAGGIQLDESGVSGDRVSAIVLIRHAHTAAVGHRLVGRSAGVQLSARGRAQLAWLCEEIVRLRPAVVYSSPLERALQTASAIASALGVTVRQDDRLTEVDFGDWTGLSFQELDSRPDWKAFNTHRSTATVPGGESAVSVQRRIVAALESIAAAHPGEVVAVVSHADVIRAAIFHFAGVSLDLVGRIAIHPASISIVSVADAEPRILLVNACEDPWDPS
jgi:probable phosphoglycerate mutase